MLICILTYNSSSTIAYTLNSVLSQTYPRDRIRIVIIDSESRDNTINIAKSMLEREGIRYEIVIERSNIPEARNKCLSLLEPGEYLVFWDSDIVTHKDSLERAIRRAIKHRCDVLGGVFIDRRFYSISELESFYREVVFREARFVERSVECSLGVPLALTVISQEVVRRGIRFDSSMTFAEDLYLGIRSNLEGFRVCALRDLEVYDISILQRDKRRLEVSISMNALEYLRGLRNKAWVFGVESTVMYVVRSDIWSFIRSSRIRFALFSLSVWILILLSIVLRNAILLPIPISLIIYYVLRQFRVYRDIRISLLKLKRVLFEGSMLYLVALLYFLRYFFDQRFRDSINRLLVNVEKCNRDVEKIS